MMPAVANGGAASRLGGETETSPGVLLASGYIAGGTLCGLIIAFSYFLPDNIRKSLEIAPMIFGDEWDGGRRNESEDSGVDHVWLAGRASCSRGHQ